MGARESQAGEAKVGEAKVGEAKVGEKKPRGAGDQAVAAQGASSLA